MNIRALVAVSVMALAASPALSASISLDSVQGTWSDVIGGKAVQGSGSSHVSWGINGRSGYKFEGVGSLTGITLDNAFKLGDFQHINKTIQTGSSISGARLTLNFVLTIDDQTRGFQTVYDMDHWETDNWPKGVACPHGAKPCADRVQAHYNAGLSDTFIIDDVIYTLALSPFDGFVTEDGLPTFWTAEGKINTSALNAVITADIPTSVPLPAALPLLAAGLAGLGLYGRRRKVTAKTGD